jgi:hypothetical protein
VAEERTASIDIDELLKELSTKIERVRVLYEQYFMGIERVEPLVPRKEVQRAMLQLQQQQIRNTGLRFRFNTMLQKWNIYVTLWNRTLREIENGTYIRHIQRAQRAAARDGKELPEEIARKVRREETPEQPVAAAPVAASPPPDPPQRQRSLTMPPPVPTDVPARQRSLTMPPPLPPAAQRPPAPTPPPPPPPRARAATIPPPPAMPLPAPPPAQAAPAPPPRPPAPTPTPPAAAPPVAAKPAASQVPGMNEAELRALHQRLVDARQKNGEKGRVTYEALVSSLSQQAGRVLGKPGVTRVRFDVAVEGGKAVVKSIPERDKK